MNERAAAAYYVLYRLSQLGFSAAATSTGDSELLACTADGSRAAVVRVRTREPNGRFALRAEDRRPAGRNVAYAFVDLAVAAEAQPSVFIVRSTLLLAMLEIEPDWPRDASAFYGLDECRDAWHLLGLGGSSVVRSESVISPS